MKAIAAFLISLYSTFSFAAETVQQHQYQPGETLSYFFEDTETDFSGEFKDGIFQPTNLYAMQELRIPYDISIVKVDADGKTERQLKFQDAFYRGGEPAAFSSSSLSHVSDIVPNFPKDFSYNYLSDGGVISKLVQIYGPYLGNEVGQFVYYKAMDIHTIQSVIDSIPSTLQVGQIKQSSAIEIDLGNGDKFHNGPTTILFQRIDVVDGVKMGFFKVVTVGNIFIPKKRNQSFTNYQYTFHVALEGKYQGLLVDGDLQETIVAPNSDTGKPVLIQRQLSVKLRWDG